MISHADIAVVTEELKPIIRARRSGSTRLLALALVAPFCAALFAQNTPPPVQPAAMKSAVEIKVTQPQGGGRLISVPVNKGVLVDFSVPIREVRLANPAIAEVAATGPKQILVSGKAFGVTQLIAWVEGGDQQVFDVAVEMDLERLMASIRATSPRANVKPAAVLDTVVLTGTVPDTESAARIMEIAKIYSPQIINQMRVAGVQQVVLRCTVAEVNRRATRQLGFNGWLGGDNFRDMFAVSQIAGINPVDIGAAAGANMRGPVPFVTDQNGLPLLAKPQLSLGFPRAQMQLFIQALRENGLLRVLAEPNLVTISGQEANFLAGGEFPVPVPQGGQANTVTIEYREFGVRLNFTPVVSSEGLIRLKVTPEVSEPDFSTAVTIQGYVVPGLVQRRVETMVELGAGQTFAIGGLLSEKVRSVSSKIPGLGDLPVLGALFGSVDFQSDETELVVLVSVDLVEPVSPDQISHVPGANYTEPNDLELFFMGQLEGKCSEKKEDRENPCGDWPVKAPEQQVGPAALRLRGGPVGPAGSSEEGM